MSDERMPTSINGKPKRVPGSDRGTNSDSAVVSVALQDAPAAEVAAVGVHVTAAPRAVEPFINCTVPLGPALLLLLEEMVAVRVTLPPAVMLVTLLETAAVVAALLIVTASVLLAALELKLLLALAV